MPDLLILTPDPANYFELEKAGLDEGFRVKVIQEIPIAHEWLKLRVFDALLVDSKVPLSEQQKLADFLWDKNPIAQLISYSFDAKSVSESTQARLFGAEVVNGPRTVESIRELLRSAGMKVDLTNQNFKIMVVEDLDSPRDIVCAYLENLGYTQVTGVASAREALTLLEDDSQEFSCVITDIRMPQMTGAELITQIRASTRNARLPVIVLTAYGTVDCLVECLRNGASGFLVKPPKRQDLVRELGRAMRIFSSGRNARLSSVDEAEYVQEMLEKKGFGR